MTSIAKDLVNLYPGLGNTREVDGGYEIWYFNTTGYTHASGYLHEKLTNQRRNLTGRTKQVSQSSAHEASGWTSEDNGSRNDLVKYCLIRI